MRCEVLDLGLVEYLVASNIQHKILEEVKSNFIDGALILAEFHPVYTIGRKGSLSNLLVSSDFLSENGIGLYETGRGGDVTVHSPGQLVAYPIFDLSLLKKDLGWYLRALEGVVISALAENGIEADRRKGLTGVWVEDKKISSIGIAVSRWITYHGLSLNVNNDLSLFDYINPCGLKGCGVTSISKIKGGPVPVEGLKRALVKKFEEIFGVKSYARIKTAAVA